MRTKKFKTICKELENAEKNLIELSLNNDNEETTTELWPDEKNSVLIIAKNGIITEIDYQGIPCFGSLENINEMIAQEIIKKF